jgi:hypothetical protein
MLSREDQHHLDEIERCLETTDPAFAARMRSLSWRRRRVTVVVGHGLWIAVGLLLVLGGWTGSGLFTAATLALTVAGAWMITRRMPPAGKHVGG